jgi:hypothetical protein
MLIDLVLVASPFRFSMLIHSVLIANPLSEKISFLSSNKRIGWRLPSLLENFRERRKNKNLGGIKRKKERKLKIEKKKYRKRKKEKERKKEIQKTLNREKERKKEIQKTYDREKERKKENF